MAATSSSALASFSGENGVIAYSDGVALAGETREIWALDPATGDQRELTSGPDDTAPAFSPSGNVLAFDRVSASTSTIFLAYADGSNATALVQGSEPAFSPSGGELVFVRPSGLFITGTAAGSPVRQLTHHAGDFEPSWGPHETIVFERSRALPVGAGGSAERRYVDELDAVKPGAKSVSVLLTYEPPEGLRRAAQPIDLRPDWSPNGKSIAVTLCNFVTETHPPTVPALILLNSCGPDVWAPDGHGLVEGDSGTLMGRVGTNCPHFIAPGTEIAWQPLRAGTLRVATAPCEPQPGPPELAVLPSESVIGSRTCFKVHGKRKCHTSR
jgi:hypothetical protein